MAKKIKLLSIGDMDGAKRLQSQLLVGGDVADYILENGKLKKWRNGDRGFDFYPTNIDYEIVTDPKEMKYQEL